MHVLTSIAPVVLILHINMLLYNGQGDFTLLGCLDIINHCILIPISHGNGCYTSIKCIWCTTARMCYVVIAITLTVPPEVDMPWVACSYTGTLHSIRVFTC